MPVPALSSDPRERLIVSLDFPSSHRAFSLLSTLHGASGTQPLWVKVGLELFLAEGAPLVRELRKQGYRVFLDLKLHDIPNTVAAAVRSLAALDIQMLTVHAAGGAAMLEAAAGAVSGISPGQAPKLLAVTVLTSMDARQLSAVGVSGDLDRTVAEQVLRLARLSVASGITGLVASALEVAMLGSDAELRPEGGLQLVTPGIRAGGSQAVDDQKRVSTAAQALRAGATQLVVGRPITQADDPGKAYLALLSEIAGADQAG